MLALGRDALALRCRLTGWVSVGVGQRWRSCVSTPRKAQHSAKSLRCVRIDPLVVCVVRWTIKSQSQSQSQVRRAGRRRRLTPCALPQHTSYCSHYRASHQAVCRVVFALWSLVFALCGNFLDGMAAVLQGAKARVAADGSPCAEALATLRCAHDEWDRALDNASKAFALLRLLLARSRLEDEAEGFAAVLRDVIAACAHSLAVASRAHDARAVWAEQAIAAAAEGHAQLVAPPIVGACDILVCAVQRCCVGTLSASADRTSM